MEHETSLSLLRTLNGYHSQQEGIFASLLRTSLVENKKVPLNTIRYMATKGFQFGAFLRNNLFRGAGVLSESEIGFLMKMIYTSEAQDLAFDFNEYGGTADENRLIDRSLTIYNKGDIFVGEAAMSRYNTPNIYVGSVARDASIAIIGKGAAGTMVFAALRAIGFTDVHIYDKVNGAGIWSQPNVHEGTKNNPRELFFLESRLATANGDGTRDGKNVKEFIDNITRRADLYTSKRIVTKVECEGKFKFKVHYEEGQNKESDDYQIVINCAGTGKPRELYDNNRMSELSTIKNKKRPIAIRWQQRLTREDVKDKSIALIGLGNSTAEMIAQLHDFINAGVNCDYKVFTHYPKDAIFNPSDTVLESGNGINFRVFRDLTKPNLTGYQGDLPRARADYMRALRENRIVPDVTSWGTREAGNKNYLTTDSSDSYDVSEYKFDKLFALIGYAHDAEDLEKKFSINSNDDGIVADYDGEFRDENGEIIKGYFGMGALMDSAHDPNAVVIPGMLFRLPDLLTTLAFRAYEIAEDLEA